MPLLTYLWNFYNSWPTSAITIPHIQLLTHFCHCWQTYSIADPLLSVLTYFCNNWPPFEIADTFRSLLTHLFNCWPTSATTDPLPQQLTHFYNCLPSYAIADPDDCDSNYACSILSTYNNSIINLVIIIKLKQDKQSCWPRSSFLPNCSTCATDKNNHHNKKINLWLSRLCRFKKKYGSA